MAFAIDHPIRRRQGPPPQADFPQYDVKIVAGKRIVIFQQEKAVVPTETPPAQKEEEPEQEEPEAEESADEEKHFLKHLTPGKQTKDKPKSSTRWKESVTKNRALISKPKSKSENSNGKNSQLHNEEEMKNEKSKPSFAERVKKVSKSSRPDGRDPNTRLFGLDQIDDEFNQTNSAPQLRSPKAFVIMTGSEEDLRRNGKTGNRSFGGKGNSKRMIEKQNSRRRLSLSDTFTVSNFDESGRFPVLPPLVRQEDPEGLRLGKLEAERRLKRVLPQVSDRTLDSMLRELRTVDRDRDRFLPTKQVSNIIKKYQLPIKDVLTFLLHQYADTSYDGMTNYEDLVAYLYKAKHSAEKEVKDKTEADPVPDHDFNKKVAERKQNISTDSSKSLERKSAFLDRDEAKLILELEVAIQGSPKFELDRFRESLQSKDIYDNGTVSKQHVVQAATTSRLELSNDLLGRWLSTCDNFNTGRYSISKLVDFLEKGRRSHLLEKRRQ